MPLTLNYTTPHFPAFQSSKAIQETFAIRCKPKYSDTTTYQSLTTFFNIVRKKVCTFRSDFCIFARQSKEQSLVPKLVINEDRGWSLIDGSAGHQ